MFDELFEIFERTCTRCQEMTGIPIPEQMLPSFENDHKGIQVPDKYQKGKRSKTDYQETPVLVLVVCRHEEIIVLDPPSCYISVDFGNPWHRSFDLRFEF